MTIITVRYEMSALYSWVDKITCEYFHQGAESWLTSINTIWIIVPITGNFNLKVPEFSHFFFKILYNLLKTVLIFHSTFFIQTIYLQIKLVTNFFFRFFLQNVENYYCYVPCKSWTVFYESPFMELHEIIFDRKFLGIITRTC